MKKLFPILIFQLTFLAALSAQEDKNTITYDNIKKSSFNLNNFHSKKVIGTPLKLYSQTILIKGKSNLNKWESKANSISAKLITNENNNDHDYRTRLNTINTLSIKIKVKDIISGNKKMDRLTHKALKSKKHPYITFFLLNKYS